MKILSRLLIFTGIGLIAFIFWPAAKEEIKFNLDKAARVKYVVGEEQLNTFEKPLTPPNRDFSVLIPKIGASAPVVANVDSQNKDEYLKALKRGVAHARGTALPGEKGNVYLFAHSTDSILNFSRYNAVFYLLGKLKPEDEIVVYHQEDEIKYKVVEVKVVNPEDVKYLGNLEEEKTLTLQTCYPPGTTLKRLVVTARQTKDN